MTAAEAICRFDNYVKRQIAGAPAPRFKGHTLRTNTPSPKIGRYRSLDGVLRRISSELQCNGKNWRLDAESRRSKGYSVYVFLRS